MDIQSILTFTINSVVLISLLFLVADFCLLLLNSWQQLSPSPQADFYQQVKDAFWDNDTELSICTTWKMNTEQKSTKKLFPYLSRKRNRKRRYFWLYYHPITGFLAGLIALFFLSETIHFSWSLLIEGENFQPAIIVPDGLLVKIIVYWFLGFLMGIFSAFKLSSFLTYNSRRNKLIKLYRSEER